MGEARLRIPTVERPAEIVWRDTDVVLVSVKSQHSEAVLSELAAAASSGVAVVSLQRRTHEVETDYLNGEVVLLGRLHRFPTPVNSLLQRLSNDLACRGGAPGAVRPEDFLSRLAWEMTDATSPPPKESAFTTLKGQETRVHGPERGGAAETSNELAGTMLARLAPPVCSR